ncbi:MAG: glycerophosphodiester phosphodiesterase family protein, partial [Polaribacter sp.]
MRINKKITTTVLLCTILLLATYSCVKTKENKSLKSNIQNMTDHKNNIKNLIKSLNNSNTDATLVIAHRAGWRNTPENSIEGIKNCIKMGVDMVEIDVHKTKDNQLVIIHDKTLDRTTTGKGLVSEWTLDSLKTLYLKNGAGHATDYKIP